MVLLMIYVTKLLHIAWIGIRNTGEWRFFFSERGLLTV
jgi:hypothetical protein